MAVFNNTTNCSSLSNRMNVWVGDPNPIGFSVVPRQCDLIITANSTGATDFQWELNPAIPFTLITQNQISVNAMHWALLPNNSLTIKCLANNRCNSSVPLEATTTVTNPDFWLCPLCVAPRVSIKAYPNPTADKLNLAFENLSSPVAQISVQNSLGVKVLEATKIDVSK